MLERDLITYPTWERYTVLSHIIFMLSVKERRDIFQMSRNITTDDDLFFPNYGISFSEFAVWYALGDGRRKTKKEKPEIFSASTRKDGVEEC